MLNPAGKLLAEGLTAHQNHRSFFKTFLLAEVLTLQTCPVPTSYAVIPAVPSNVRRAAWLTFGKTTAVAHSPHPSH